MTEGVRTAAFLLPQFHPIPENDEAWGAGFTEWRNVVQARPRHRRQLQPRLPADLGFYDLRLPDTREAQARLAAAHGIDAFCWYHYWFNGRRVLQRPFDEVLASGQPDFPFFVCWANENWTRRWDGKDSDVILRQEYSPEDDRRHLEHLLPTLLDPRYLQVDGRPLLLVFKASELPDAAGTAARWRDVAGAHGVELCLGRVDSTVRDRGDPRRLGFDVAVDFQPRLFSWQRAARTAAWAALHRSRLSRQPLPPDHVRSYDRAVRRAVRQPDPGWRRYPCVSPGWDNTPRRRRGAVVYRGSSPAAYAAWLHETVVREQRAGGGLVFVNAWNEWAEGAVLEPDLHWGRAYLEAHRDVLAALA